MLGRAPSGTSRLKLEVMRWSKAVQNNDQRKVYLREFPDRFSRLLRLGAKTGYVIVCRGATRGNRAKIVAPKQFQKTTQKNVKC